jgi:hypothetical protein
VRVLVLVNRKPLGIGNQEYILIFQLRHGKEGESWLPAVGVPQHNTYLQYFHSAPHTCWIEPMPWRRQVGKESWRRKQEQGTFQFSRAQ